jgi:hypothetical protein
LLFLARILLISDRIKVFKVIKFGIRNQTGGVIIPHTNSIRIEYIGHTKLGILITKHNPNKRSILIPLSHLTLHLTKCRLILNERRGGASPLNLYSLNLIRTAGSDYLPGILA